MGSGDCTLLNAVWTILWNPASGQWYLPNIFKNGLDAGGIKIPPLDTVNVPAFPDVSLFKEDPWGSISITLDKGTLTGLPTCSSLGALKCNDTDPNVTTFTAGMKFSELDFAGNYVVNSGGVVGCAMSTAAFFLGGGLADALVAAGASSPEDVEQQMDLARAYRDHSLQANDNGTPNRNGQMMVGTYYLHQDTINEVIQDGANTNVRARLTARPAQDMSTQVTLAAQGQQGDGIDVPLPSNGAPAFDINNSIAAVCMSKIIGHKDPDDRYFELLTDQTAFYNSVVWAQKNKTSDTKTVSGVLDVVRTADPEQTTGGSGGANIRVVPAEARANVQVPEQAMPIYDEDGGLLAYVTLDGPQRRAQRTITSPDGVGAPLPGTFLDKFTDVSAEMTATMKLNGDQFVVTVDALIVTLPAVEFVLTYTGGGWSPALFTKVVNAVASNNGLKNAVTTRISSVLNDENTRAWLSNTLTTELNKTAGKL